MSELPPLPKGFVLDAGQQTNAIPTLPAGFTLDAPQGNQMVSAITDIPSEIYSAGKSALGSIAENLNPFSKSRIDSIEHQSNAPSMLAGLGENISQTLGVGKGLAAIPELVTSPITGTARSAIGHPYSALTGMPYEQAKDAVDTAMMGLKPSGASPRGIISKPAPTPTQADIGASAGAGFDQVQSSGGALKSDALKNLGASIQNELTSRGLRREFAGDTHAVLDDLAKPPLGSVATMADVKALRESLTQAGNSIDGRQRMAAGIAKEKLDKYLENIPASHVAAGDPQMVAQTLKAAIGDYKALKQSQDITNRIDKAENNAGAANSGMNVENSLRQQFKQILNNPKQARGYSKEQLAVIRKFVRGDITADALRAAGNLMGGGLGMHGAAMAGAGFLAAGPVGLAAPIAGMATKYAGNALARSRTAALDNMIRANSPLARSLPSVQAPLPSPLLGAAVPYQFPQALPFFRGAVPAYADQNDPRRR